nr:hypothetical protein [Variovorax paradoxus]
MAKVELGAARLLSTALLVATARGVITTFKNIDGDLHCEDV